MFKKLTADYLFTGKELLNNGEVLLLNDGGLVEAVVSANEAGEDVEKIEGIICPGFINTHCHLELSHLKNTIPQHTGLVGFVQQVMAQRAADDAQIQQAIVLAEKEMLQEGIVAVGDICNTAHTIPQKQQKKLHYYNFIETTGWIPAMAEKRYEQAVHLLQSFALPKNIVPHAPYSVSEVLWEKIAPHFANAIVTMHNQETPDEDALFQKGEGLFLQLYQQLGIHNPDFVPSGKSSIQTVAHHLAGAATLIAVHNTYTHANDWEWLLHWAASNKVQLYAGLCVNANRYIEQQVPSVSTMLQMGIPITIGTDSLASNTRLSILHELQTIQTFFPDIPIATLLQWATLNGAKALGMEAYLGSFEQGKQPGVLQLTGINIQKNQLHHAQVKRLL